LGARLADAAAVDPATDPNGEVRDAADSFAIRLLKAAARVGAAIGKASGNRTINIVVTRQELLPPAPPPPPVVQRIAPSPEMEANSRRMYEAFMKTDALRRKLIESGRIGDVRFAEDCVEAPDGELVAISDLVEAYESQKGAAEGEGAAIPDG